MKDGTTERSTMASRPVRQLNPVTKSPGRNVAMPEPDDEVASLYGSDYGRYPHAKQKQVAPAKQARAQMPDPDSEVESLIDFESRASN